jgi:hypothetical protein
MGKNLPAKTIISERMILKAIVIIIGRSRLERRSSGFPAMNM